MEADRLRRFFDAQAFLYDATRRHFLPGRREALDALGIRPGDHVLDFACGTGLNFPGLLARGASRITGVDLSKNMLERARQKAPDATLIQADLTQGDLGIRADRAICSYALSLIDAPEDAFRAISRHLKPGGTLVIHDFHEMHAGFGPVAWAWKRWVTWFGVRFLATALEREAARHFERTQLQLHAGRACYILRCSGPRTLPKA